VATLQAVVDIHDRASDKFVRMTAAAKAFEEQLDAVDHKLTEIEAKMQALSRMKVSMRVTLDTSTFDSQLAALMARAKVAGLADVGGGGGLGGYAMSAGGLMVPSGYAMPAVTGDAEESPMAKIVDTSRARRVGIGQADNGILGFAIVTYRALRNLNTVIEPVTQGFRFLFSTVLENGLKVFELFGKNTAQVGAALRAAVPLAASLAGTITTLTVAAAALVAIGTTLAAVLGLIAAALTSLLVPLAALTAGIGAVVGVIGFVAVPMIKWISDTKKLVDEKDELNKKIKTLDKSTKEYTQTQDRLNEIQKELNKSGAEGVFRQMQQFGDKVSNAVFTDKNTQLFTDILASGMKALEPLLPILTKLVNVFATEIAKVAENFRQFTKDPENLALIMSFFETGAKLIQPMANALGLLGKIFMQIGVAVGPIAETMLKDFVGWLNQISDNLSKPGGLRGLGDFFAEMYPVFKGLVVLLKDFVGGFVEVGRQNAPELLSMIKWLGEVGSVFVKWINETVDKYGPFLARVFKAVGNAIGIVWDIATKLYDAFEPIVDIGLNIIEVVIEMFRAGSRLAEISHVIDIIRIALEIILYPFNLVLEVIKRVLSAAQEMFTALKDSAVGQAIASVFEVIKGAIDKVATVVDKIIGGIKWLKEAAGWLFGGGDPAANAQDRVDAVNRQRQDLINRGYTPSGDPLNPALTPPPTTNPIFGGGSGNGASGAIVTRPTRALIGESGPEAVVPLSATRGSRRLSLDNRAGAPVQISGDIHITGVQNLDQFVTEVQKYVSNLPRESSTGMSVG